MYVRTLQIENLRCFERAEVELQFPGREPESPLPLPNVNLLLGNNGAGKTTVLRAVALSVLGESLPGSGYVPYNLVRRRKYGEAAATAKIKSKLVLHTQDDESIPEGQSTEWTTQTAFSSIKGQELFGSLYPGLRDTVVSQKLFDDSSPAFLLLGYGATRYIVGADNFEPLASQLRRRRLRYLRVAGLFEDHLGLAPLESWLRRLQQEEIERFVEVADLLNDLLPREARFTLEMRGDEYVFQHCGIPVPVGALSDGYRAYIGWVSDLLFHISSVTPKGAKLRDIRGVVMVDEIDLHLHPEWQREVVPTIANALPSLQFILTTHSPIVAGTLTSKNIFVLEMDNAGASTIEQYTEPIHGLNADQILVSSYFNLDTTRAPEAVNELVGLSKKAMSGDSDAALEFLKRIAAGTERP
jgi:predicted ATP-binding protein involved in virulence